MAEFNMIPTTTGLKIMDYEPVEIQVNIFEISPINPIRVQKIYNDMMFIPIIKTTDDTELIMNKEIREWDVILPFGVDNKVPRRNPTEILYKGKKIKHSFI